MIRPTMLVVSVLVLLTPDSGRSAEGQSEEADEVDAEKSVEIEKPGTRKAIPGRLRYRMDARSSSGEKDLRLEQALVHEEGIDLDAAIEIYRRIVTGFDNRRPGAAYAIFRLGECYRKQDKPEKAATQYRRILDEFSDQQRLAELSHERLQQLGEKVPRVGRSDESGVKAREISKYQPATSEEAKELERVQTMIENSPDLINARDQDGIAPLHIAARNGYLVVARLLLDDGAETQITNIHRGKEYPGRHFTPLHEAVENGHKAMTELLLDGGANPNAPDTEGATALHYAAAYGYSQVAKALIDHGAKLNLKGMAEVQRGGDYQDTPEESTPIHLAAEYKQPAVAKVLLEKGANANLRNADGNTPLHLVFDAPFYHDGAAQKLTRLLLDNGADPNAPNADQETPLHEAMWRLDDVNSPVKIVRLLLEARADPNATDDRGETPLHRVAQISFRGGPKVLKMLLQFGGDPNSENRGGRTPLHIATDNGIAKNVRLLLEAGASVDGSPSHGRTPLHAAIYSIARADDNRKGTSFVEVAKILLANGADPDAADGNGGTPLHTAARYGRYGSTEYGGTEAARLLLANGADINAKDEDGNTPLHIAVDEGGLRLMELLLEEGADVAAENSEGKTPLGLAKEKQKTYSGLSPEHRSEYYFSQKNITEIINLLTRYSGD